MTDVVVAVRAWVERAGRKPRKGAPTEDTRAGWPTTVLVLDAETTVDAAQRLTFGSYRYFRWDSTTLRCVSEGLFYDDDLPTRDPDGFAQLVQYARTHRAEVAPDVPDADALRLYPRRPFVDDVLWHAAHETEALVVGFNLPFDLSRLAVDVGDARGRFRGGFSFLLWDYLDATTGTYRERRFRPRLAIKHLDSRRAFMGFAAPWQGQRPRGKGPPPVRGRFLDLKTLALALTGKRSISLEVACKTYGVAHGKRAVGRHGVVTEDYIDYNRSDVRATSELLEKLRAELDRHPIAADPCKVFSEASIAKAYLTAMGVNAPRLQFRDVPPEIYGRAMVAYYGGRAEAHIRKVVGPLAYCDFRSMYPTVNSLMGLWRLLTAQRLEVVDATADVRRLLQGITLDGCFDPTLWPELTFYALIEPDRDILPVRARYRDESDEFNIGINPLDSPTQPLWYAGPDLVASVLLSGHVPRVLRAFRLVPSGRQRSLRPVRLRGAVVVDPRTEDFFRAVIEARARAEVDAGLSSEDRERLSTFLKVFANSGSYGIFVEMNREELALREWVAVTVYGIDGRFRRETGTHEEAGPFCFPPIGALIPAAARLMLTLLERSVTDGGGAYAFCDTDSMAIVASRAGGLVPCPGGPHALPNGTAAIQALSWEDVNGIIARFATLNPYNRTAVPGSILDLEDENFDPVTRSRRELFAFVISAKRYVLFNDEPDGRITIRKPSEHGLGHLLDPADPAKTAPEHREPFPKWIGQVWEWIVLEALGRPTGRPPWLHRPAVSQVTISTPTLLRPFAERRSEVPYGERIKPMNFVLTVHVARLGGPPGSPRVHLIAPYTKDAKRWLHMPWTDIYSGRGFGISTAPTMGDQLVQVKCYGDVLREYREHPEAKSAGSDGVPCARETVGLLRRRPVRAVRLRYIGKESNRLEEVDRGLIHDWADVQEIYDDPRPGSQWSDVVRMLRHVPRDKLALETGTSARWVQRLRNDKARPSSEIRATWTRIAFEAARGVISNPGAAPEERRAAERLIAPGFVSKRRNAGPDGR
jgi:hypothetical protein